MNWHMANRVASIAAVQAHDALGIDPAQLPISVTEAIEAAGVTLMWRPLPHMFGAYLNDPGASPGILVNNGLNRAGRRQTAAHELGHHMLQHQSSIDIAALDIAAGSDMARPGWSPSERAAEAFAHWFLMPRRAVVAAVENLGGRCDTPDVVYQASLHLGVGYQTLLRHLIALRMLDRATAATWGKVQPSLLKRRAVGDYDLTTTHDVDVRRAVQRGAGRTIHASPGDLITFTSDHRVAVDGPLEIHDHSTDQTIVLCREPLTSEPSPGSCHTSHGDTRVWVHPRPHGLQLPAHTQLRMVHT